jgi:prepilin-type N-terminal cleavage/methylation domain-containing protein
MTRRTTWTRRANQHGFTLVELMVAILISSMVMVAVSASFVGTLNAHYEIDTANGAMATGQRVLDTIERDLRGLWHYNVKGNKVLFGRNRDIGGFDADWIDFVTTTDTIRGVPDVENRITPTGISEVGYWLRDNRETPGLLELARREDALIDDDITRGGEFQVLCDRVKSLNITYYQTLGFDAEPVDEWDSSRDGLLPRRIKIELKVHRRMGNRNQVSGLEIGDDGRVLETYVRHIVFEKRYDTILQAGVAMVPVAPIAPADQPTSGAAGAGGEGGGGPLGGGGGGARGPGGGLPGLGEIGVGANPGMPPGQGRGGNRQPGPGRGGLPPGGNPGLNLGDLLRGGGSGLPGGLFGGGQGGGSGNPFGGARR